MCWEQKGLCIDVLFSTTLSFPWPIWHPAEVYPGLISYIYSSTQLSVTNCLMNNGETVGDPKRKYGNRGWINAESLQSVNGETSILVLPQLCCELCCVALHKAKSKAILSPLTSHQIQEMPFDVGFWSDVNLGGQSSRPLWTMGKPRSSLLCMDVGMLW